MKKRIRGILPCVAVLIIVAVIHYHNLKVNYDEIFEYSGLWQVNDFESDLKKENERAIENKQQYREIVETPEGNDLQEEREDETKKEDLKLYALSALLMDASNGRVLYEENGYNEMAMASTTKIMTCIVTLENASLEEVVTVSKNAARMPDVQLHINSGEQYYLKDLLYSLMLESHNDVAVAIAEHVGGSVEGFATMMNEKAKELGCSHTNFVTPNGLDSEKHYTTAAELALIASYAIKNETFINITNTSSWQFKEITKGRSFSVNNKDKFLYLYDGAIGIKTGFTNRAGYCFVGAVDKNDKTFVSVVLGSGWPPNKNYKWHDTTSLMDYGLDNFEQKQIFNSNKEFEPVYVVDGQEKYVHLYYEGDISLLMSGDEVAKVVYKIPKELKAPVTAEMLVGSAKYYIGEDLIEEVPILTSNSVDKIDFAFCLGKTIDLWFLR